MTRLHKHPLMFTIGNDDTIPQVNVCQGLQDRERFYITCRDDDSDVAQVEVSRDELRALADWIHARLERDRIAEIALSVVEGCAKTEPDARDRIGY